MTAVPPWTTSASAAYSPFAPSPLSGPALSSTAQDSPVRTRAPEDQAHWSSDPAMPSSPTPPSRPTARSASYKSRTSSRRVASSSSSSSAATSSPFQALSSSSPVRANNALANETRRLAQENSRLSRARILKLHHLASRSPSTSADTSTIPDGPGGWVDGEWEEFDEEELARLEIEARKARREYEYRMRRMAELASEEGAWFGPDEVDQETAGGIEREEEEPEPPPDILFDETELEAFDLGGEGNDSLMLDDDQDDDHHDAHAPPLVSPDPYPDPDPQQWPSATSSASSSSRAAFDSSLLSTPFCPACGATDRPLAGDPERGLYCAGGGGAQSGGGCGWGIGMDILLPLKEAFLRHGSPLMGHAPLLSYTPFTGTVILCSEPICDEQYGA